MSEVAATLADAEAAANSSNYLRALTLLTPLQPYFSSQNHHRPAAADPQLKRYLQLQALSRILLADQRRRSSSYWEAFGLDEATASTFEIRRQFKRLAALVHPDKCALSAAGAAFAALQRGVEELQLEAAGEAVGEGGSAGNASEERERKRARKNDAAEGGDFYDEGDEFAWWTEWEAAAKSAKKEGPKEKEEGRGSYFAAGVAEDAAALEGMSVEELQVEVRARQDAMLGPPITKHHGDDAGTDSQAPRHSLHSLREGLLRARSVLNAKLQKAAQDNAAEGLEGGFLRS